MEDTRKWKKGSFSTILWAVLGIVLCAAPSVHAQTVPEGEEWDIPSIEHPGPYNFLTVNGTANILSGAVINYDLQANAESVVNIKGGSIGDVSLYGVTVSIDSPAATVTVYGTDFEGSITGPITDSSWTPDSAGEILSGKYEGNVAFSILVRSDFPINLLPPGTTNQPPVALAGRKGLIGPGGKIHPIYSSEQDLTTVLGQASDPEEQPIVYRWLEGTTVLLDWTPVGTTELPEAAYLNLSTINPLLLPFSIGDHTLVLEVQEVSGDMLWSADDMVLRILNTPPSAGANPPSMTVGIGDPISIGAEVADFDGDTLTYEWREGTAVIASGTTSSPSGGDPISIASLDGTGGITPFELGLNFLVIAVTDSVNPWEVSEIITVEVIDTEAPTLTPTASEIMLWPPNHTLRPITIQANAEDNSGGPVTLDVEVTSNEPDEDDWVIDSIDNATGEIQLRLRAERSGSGDGRVYTVTITATDEADNSSTAIVEIRVPHDKRKK